MKMRAPRRASAALRSVTAGDEATKPSPRARNLAISSVAGNGAVAARGTRSSAGRRCQRVAARSAVGGSA